MFFFNYTQSARQSSAGLSLVSALISIAIMTVVFFALFSTLQRIIDMISRQKAEAGAVALISERMEYIRSLAYNDVGTFGGIVPGNLPQIGTTTLNGVEYTERIVVLYKDDPADGLLLADSNGITADYKIIKVQYTWDHKGELQDRSMVSNIVPRGIETLAGGGTLVINVFDATASPVPSAEVRVVNNSTSPVIDTTVFTNANGIAMFPGAPAAANYQISVTKTGYSSDQTYTADISNPNPNPPHIAVIESSVSSVSFSIDELSDLEIITRGVPATASFTDGFNDASLLFTQSSTTISGGVLLLDSDLGGYVASGTAQATTTAPTLLNRWLTLDVDAVVPTSTTLAVGVYSVDEITGVQTLVPDSDLPGNSSGFQTGSVSLNGVSTTTYPRLAIGALLETTAATATPTINEWSISYEVSEVPVVAVAIDVLGSKTIGATAALSPIYKTNITVSTDSNGVALLNDFEWDFYTVTIDGASEGYDIAEACRNIPYALNPGVAEQLVLTLVPDSTNSLRVFVGDSSGIPIAGAEVVLSRGGFSETQVTSSCGQVFFNSGLPVATDYVLDISAPGYTSENTPDVTIDGVSIVTANLAI